MVNIKEQVDDISLEVPTTEYADEIISFKNEMISSGSDLDGRKTKRYWINIEDI